jgi:flagellar hook assembly protein FlgD
VEVYNCNGQLVQRIDLNSNQTQIEFNEAEKGIYLLKIKTAIGSYTDKVSVY